MNDEIKELIKLNRSVLESLNKPERKGNDIDRWIFRISAGFFSICSILFITQIVTTGSELSVLKLQDKKNAEAHRIVDNRLALMLTTSNFVAFEKVKNRQIVDFGISVGRSFNVREEELLRLKVNGLSDLNSSIQLVTTAKR